MFRRGAAVDLGADLVLTMRLSDIWLRALMASEKTEGIRSPPLPAPHASSVSVSFAPRLNSSEPNSSASASAHSEVFAHHAHSAYAKSELPKPPQLPTAPCRFHGRSTSAVPKVSDLLAGELTRRLCSLNFSTSLNA